MSSSPFNCNQKNLFSSTFKAKEKSSPPEPVVLIADPNSIITVEIPYGTKNAPTIRAHMHSNIVTTDNKRVFIYRQMNGWTNIHLDSTEACPKLTMDPIHTLKLAWREFTDCPQVSTVTIRWKDGTVVNGYDGIDDMDGQFTALPEPTDSADATPTTTQTDAEVLHDALMQVMRKVESMEQHITDMSAKYESAINSVLTSRDSIAKQTTGTSAGASSSSSAIVINDDDNDSINAGKTDDPATSTRNKRKARK